MGRHFEFANFGQITAPASTREKVTQNARGRPITTGEKRLGSENEKRDGFLARTGFVPIFLKFLQFHVAKACRALWPMLQGVYDLP